MDPLLLFDVEPTGKKELKRKRDEELLARRYYMHKQLPAGFKVHSFKKLIKAPYYSYKEIPIGPRYYVSQLMKLGEKVEYLQPKFKF
jgi:hypothetical protein